MTNLKTLSLAAAAAALLAAGPAGAQQEVNASRPAAATGNVEITINDGSLRVVGWGRNEVRVTGTLNRAGDRLELDGGGRGTDVRVQGRSGRPGGATLEVRVPAGSSVEVITNNAPVIVTGVSGAVETVSRSGVVTVQGAPRTVEVTSQAGGITVNAQTDRVNLTSVSGPVRVSGVVRQRAEINAVSGAVDVDARVGEVAVHAVNGAVRVTSVTGGRVEVNSVSGAVVVTGTRLRGNVASVAGQVVVSGTLGGTLNLESHAGGVELRLPPAAGAEVQVSSWSGGLDSDWPLRRDGREWRGRIGDGGPRVNITTFSGRVKLTRR